MNRLLLLSALLLFAAGGLHCAHERPAAGEADAVPAEIPPPPEPIREFRAAWIATVANIDWPSRPGLPAAAQQAELLRLLDRAVVLGLNAIVLQVRPAADALYASELEPWSEFLTGEMGRPPEPFYDPLAFAVEEAHRRGLELHAWFNPFRARHPSGTSEASPDHASRAHPDLVLDYGRYQWLDPGLPEARAHALAVMLDVVRRYDLDGVHLDDYFYPYAEQDSAGREIPFPDTLSWARAQAEGTTLGLDDWRRQNVDQFIAALYAGVKTLKPHVKVGISPFGIWRPGHPPGVAGFDAFASLYADARKWLRAGWVDYFSPQLYWPVDAPQQPFEDLLAWWLGENPEERHVWPGLFTSRVGDRWEPGEIARQIRIVRVRSDPPGHIHFSMRALLPTGTGLSDTLASAVYEAPALVPPTDWLGGRPLGAPTARLEHLGEGDVVAMAADGHVWRWILRVRRGTEWSLDLVPGWRRAVILPRSTTRADEVRLSYVDRLGRESAYVTARPERP